jgi:hypothetical protein
MPSTKQPNQTNKSNFPTHCPLLSQYMSAASISLNNIKTHSTTMIKKLNCELTNYASKTNAPPWLRELTAGSIAC